MTAARWPTQRWYQLCQCTKQQLQSIMTDADARPKLPCATKQHGWRPVEGSSRLCSSGCRQW